MERLAAWLLTETGKKAVFITAFLGTTGSAIVQCLPHTFLMNQYMDFVHFHEYEISYFIHKKMSNLFLSDME